MSAPSTRYRLSETMLERALRTIPLGSQTFSKSLTQYPRGVSPYFIQRGAGSHELRVGNAGPHAGASFHHHRMTAASTQLLDRFGRGGHTRLARINFGRNADAHRVEPLISPDSTGWPGYS